MRSRSPSSIAAVTALVCLFGAGSARAASLQKVDRGTWSTDGVPNYVNMFIYVPDKLAPKPPILVASHHCGGSANSTFNETKSNFVSLADQQGFVMIVPEATGHNCWDVGSATSLKHDGGGDTHAVAQMVRYALQKYGGDAKRVYAFGTSSGAMMTQALLGVYPDLFVAGVAVAGVACGCWAEQYSASNQWSGPCANGTVKKSAEDWGNQVRAMFPEYMGHRPRVQLWHGTADTTISFNNLNESIKQWTNVLSLSTSPTGTTSEKTGYEHKRWQSDCGFVVLDTWAQQGAGHDVRWDFQLAAAFLGLDKSDSVDPEAVACPSGVAQGTAGAPGMSGAAGQVGAPTAGASGAAGMRGEAGFGASFAGSGGGAGVPTAGRTLSATAGTSSPSGAAGVDARTGAVLGGAGRGATTTSTGTSIHHASAAGAAVPAQPAEVDASPTRSSNGCSLAHHSSRAVSAQSSTLLLAALGLLGWRRTRRAHGSRRRTQRMR